MSGEAAVVPALGLTVLGLAAAMLWGASDFLGGIATRRANAFLVVGLAHSLSLALLVLFALATHSPGATQRTAVWGLVTGVLGGVALILFYQAMALGEMGLTAALTGLLTAVVPMIASFLTEGLPRTSQIIGFVIAAAAIWLIAYAPATIPHPRGLGLATMAGIGFGGFLITSKYASTGNGIAWPLVYSRIASASIAWGMVFWLRVRHRNPVRDGERPSSMRSIALLAATAGVLEVLGNLAYMTATQTGRLDVAAVLASLYPAGPILLAAVFLKERTTPRQAFGMALALGAVVLISL